MNQEPVAKLNLYDLLLLIARWRKLFIINVISVAVIACVVVLILPVWYQARTVILPPSNSGGGSIPSFLTKDMVGVAANFGLDVPSDNIYQTILGSRSLKEIIISKFNLREVYKAPKDVFPEDLVKAFNGHYSVNTNEDQSIEITVEDQDPQRAADMANACTDELDSLYRTITSKTARNNRVYIGKRLAEINDSLASLQDSLQRFQQQYTAISLDDQTSVMITAASQIKAQQLAADIQADVLRQSLGEHHPQVAQLEATSREMSNHYDAILSGKEGKLFLNLEQLPSLGRRYADLYRQIRIQATLLEGVYPQYESARIQEERETSNVQVLDPARVPFKKFRPPRRIIVMVAVALSIVVTLVIALIKEYLQRLPASNANDWEKLQRLSRFFRKNR